MNRIAAAWQRIVSPAGWSCPGDGCSGVFRSPERAADHAQIARIIGSHDNGPVRRARHQRARASRQLARQAGGAR